MMKLIKKLFLLGFVLSILGGVFLAGIFTNDALSDPEVVIKTEKDYYFSHGSGESMFPTLPEERSPTIVFRKEPQIGDIVSFVCLPNSRCSDIYEAPTVITHRLISIKPDGCMEIRGDNVATRDPNEPCYYPDKDIKINGVVYGLIK